MYILAVYSSIPWLAWVIMIAYYGVILSCVIVILSENRNPIRSLAWVIGLLALPGVGLIFYLFFGRSLKGRHIISRHNKRKLLHNFSGPQVKLENTGIDDSGKQIVKLAYSLTRSPLTLNNRIRIFTSGAEKFDSLIMDLKAAKSTIYLQYYIFSDDQLGNTIADILMDKAKAGIKVKVIYDNVGSLSTSGRFFKRMRETGIDIHPFFRVTFPQLANRINWRNHRKIAVIDNKIGYIGGMNIADRYVKGTENSGIWRDTHFRVEGDIIRPMLYSFVVDWQFLRENQDGIEISIPENRLHNGCGLQLVTDGPLNNWDNLSLSFLRIISSAKRSIYIQTPYFLPNEALLNALEAAAFAKVDVRIMMPSSSDSKLLNYASFSYVSQCLKSNIKIYLYEPGMLHAKTMIVDDNFVTAGSTNFDFRSFENNFESNLFIYDAAFNRQMKDLFFEDLKNCRKVTLTNWRQRPLLQRSIESFVRLFAPLL